MENEKDKQIGNTTFSSPAIYVIGVAGLLALYLIFKK